MEIWKDIEGFEGYYQVSNMGNVRNKKGLIKKIRYTKSNYLITDLYINKKYKTYYIHRLVAMAFIDGYFDGAEVDHINTIRDDNRACNLRWVTRSENMNNEITKEKSKESKIGMKLSDETKKKISNNTIGNKHWNYGKNWDDCIKNKNRLSQSNRIKVICIETNIIYDSISLASKLTNINQTSIRDCVNNKQKTAGGYHWEVMQDGNNSEED